MLTKGPYEGGMCTCNKNRGAYDAWPAKTFSNDLRQKGALSSRTRCGKMCTSCSECNTGSHQSTHLSAMAELKDSTGFLKPQ